MPSDTQHITPLALGLCRVFSFMKIFLGLKFLAESKHSVHSRFYCVACKKKYRVVMMNWDCKFIPNEVLILLCCSHAFILLVFLYNSKLNDHIWWLVRVTLVAAFGFFSKILGGGRNLWMIILLQNEFSLCGGGSWRRWVHTVRVSHTTVSLICMSTHKALAARFLSNHQAWYGQPAIRVLAMAPLRRLALSMLFTIMTTSNQTTCTVSKRSSMKGTRQCKPTSCRLLALWHTHTLNLLKYF